VEQNKSGEVPSKNQTVRPSGSGQVDNTLIGSALEGGPVGVSGGEEAEGGSF
jgi:hypothetical protein